MPTQSSLIEKKKDGFTIDDVGSTLLQHLAKGIYEPREVMREYVQNAVDAHRLWKNEMGTDPEGPIQIEIRGNKISILDYGIGMEEKEIRKVKSIAVSQKRSADVSLTGYKGVGIWAGLSYFKKLKVYSTKRGSKRGYQLTIDFKRIVDSISDDASIGDVLNPSPPIEVYEEAEDDHFTIVTLEEPLHSQDWFLDPNEIADAVRRVCPCEIDSSFAFYGELSEWYKSHNLELFSIQVDGKRIVKTYPSVVENFEKGSIPLNDREVAVYWRAIHKDNRILSEVSTPEQLIGFRVIQYGFALGDQNLYGNRTESGFEELRVASYLDWHIGEIHVTLPDLNPDLPRRRFEESEIARQFVGRLRDWYQEVCGQARVLSCRRNYLRDLDRIDRALDAWPAQKDKSTIVEDKIDQLLDFEARILEDDAKAIRSRKNKTPDLVALRATDVKAKRKRVLGKITKLKNRLPDRVLSRAEAKRSTNSGGNGSSGSKTPSDASPKGTAQESNLGTKRRKGQIPLDFPEQDEVGNRGVRAALDVVFALLKEVLSEEISDNPKKVETIIDKLKKRVSAVVTDA